MAILMETWYFEKKKYFRSMENRELFDPDGEQGTMILIQ